MCSLNEFDSGVRRTLNIVGGPQRLRCKCLRREWPTHVKRAAAGRPGETSPAGVMGSYTEEISPLNKNPPQTQPMVVREEGRTVCLDRRGSGSRGGVRVRLTNIGDRGTHRDRVRLLTLGVSEWEIGMTSCKAA